MKKISLLLSSAFLSISVMAAPIKVAVADFFPLGDSNPNNVGKGIFYDIVKRLEDESGVPFDIEILPISRLNILFKEGEVEMSVGFKKQNGELLDTFGCHENILVTQNSSQLTNTSDLKAQKIGFVNKGIYQKLYATKFETDNVYVNSDESLFSMLVRDRIDGFFVSNVVFESFLQYGELSTSVEKKWRDQLKAAIIISESAVGLHISKNIELSEKTKNELIAALNRMREGGDISAIYRKYGVMTEGRCIADQPYS